MQPVRDDGLNQRWRFKSLPIHLGSTSGRRYQQGSLQVRRKSKVQEAEGKLWLWSSTTAGSDRFPAGADGPSLSARGYQPQRFQRRACKTFDSDDSFNGEARDRPSGESQFQESPPPHVIGGQAWPEEV